jgi:aspartyl protease family protein
MALEVADEYVRRAPATANAHYLRGVALEGLGDYARAIGDYATAIELFEGDKAKIGTSFFLRMANAYAKLERYCEAANPIQTWVAIDPARRDTSWSQKIIADYERQGNCPVTVESLKERFALRGDNRVVLAKGEINGVKGTFIIDTGASYVSLKSGFAQRAKISTEGASTITLATANGHAKGKLTRANAVSLGRLRASNVPVVVQETDEKSYGAGVDGLLGMSFLSRFEVQMARGFIEIRTRQRR